MAEEALEAELHYGSGIGVQQDGALIAYTLWRVDEGLMDITRLGVRSGYRRMGLGRILLRTARITARLPAMLTVKKDNAEALALYRAEGFRVVGDLRTGAWVMRAPAI